MRKSLSTILTAAILSAPILLQAQQKSKPATAKPKKAPAAKVYDKAHTGPQPPFSTNELKHYFREKLTWECDMNQFTLQCIVNTDGSLSDVSVKEADIITAQCVKELKQVAAQMPKWKPGRNSAGKAIRVRYSADISVPMVIGEEIREGTTMDIDFPTAAPATEPEPPVEVAPTVRSAENHAEFPDLKEYIRKNLVYPAAALKAGTAGVVRLRLMIGTNGKVSNVLIISRLGNGCTEEAIRLVQDMPAWKPATRNGKPVQTAEEVAVEFRLPGDYTAEGPRDLKTPRTSDTKMPPKVMAGDAEPLGSENEVLLYTEQQPEFPTRRDTVISTFVYRHRNDKSRTIQVSESEQKDVNTKDYEFVKRIDRKVSTYGLMEYLQDNIRYPQLAVDAGVEGKVYIRFVVEKDGSTSDVKVLKSIGMGCDEEAMRVVKNMPRWKPGMQGGKPVRVAFTLPVRFALE